MATNCPDDKSQLIQGSEKANYSNFTATVVFFSSSQKVKQKKCLLFILFIYFIFLTFKMLGRVPSEEKLRREKCQV